jgi:succinate dehydrogenase / fumarate reductase iron-sulfur subunit
MNSILNVINSYTKTSYNSIIKLKPQDFVCYRIFRYDPSIDDKPWIQSWYLPARYTQPMLLDSLFYIKNNKDESLSFRRSCREGICGSCAMNINGVNTLACTYQVGINLSYINPYISIYPLPHMPVVKDLIVSLKHFYQQYKSIDPFLKRKTIEIPNTEFIQSREDRFLLDGLYECILCACCSTSCPSYWWNKDRYLGPAVLLQAFRWIIDSRDQYTKERLESINDAYKLYRCHTILNCVKTCPKNLSPVEAISSIKRLISLQF